MGLVEIRRGWSALGRMIRLACCSIDAGNDQYSKVSFLHIKSEYAHKVINISIKMIIPDNFTVKSKTLSTSSSNMKLKSNGKKIGNIVKTDLKTGRQYELINSHKELIAIARKYHTEHGNILSIFDAYNNKIGSIERIVYLQPAK